MVQLYGAILIGVGLWMAWVPWREHHHATRTGEARLSFSRMLLRMMAAGCVLAIGAMVAFSAVVLAGRTALFEIVWWLCAFVLAMLLFVVGVVERLFVKRDYLLGQKEILQRLVKTEDRAMKSDPSQPSRNAPSGNGHNAQ